VESVLRKEIGGNDLRKTQVLNRKCKREGVMDTERGHGTDAVEMTKVDRERKGSVVG